jgi:hypothetical protein
MSSDDNLYVVVHHRDDPEQPYANCWLDENRLEAITTTAKIAGLCLDEQKKGKYVYVHRCRWADNPPVICCRALVELADPVGYVKFKDQEVLASTPAVTLGRGQNFYWA